MSNIQSQGITQAILSNNHSSMNILMLEPLLVKKDELKEIECGQIIELGKKFPKLFISKNSTIVGQARLGAIGDRQVIHISAKERILDLARAGANYTIVEPKIAVLPRGKFTVGKLVDLPVKATENILLFSQNRLLAKATLLMHDKVYALHIIEVFDA